MATGLRATVDPTPNAPPRVGLLASANVVTVGEGDPRLGGIRQAPEQCGNTDTADPCDYEAGTPGTNPGIVEADTFYVRAWDSCSTFERSRDRDGRARRLLEACQSFEIARELWDGVRARAGDEWPNPYLANEGSDVVTSGAPASPIDALGCLEKALGECQCGQRGMIHATRDVVTAWAADMLVQREGNLLTTVHQTVVVPDAGYTGRSPLYVLPTEGSTWAYATGMVQVILGPVELPASDLNAQVAIADNDQIVVAQRLATVWWSGCCHVAAQIDMPACGIGGS